MKPSNSFLDDLQRLDASKIEIGKLILQTQNSLMEITKKERAVKLYRSILSDPLLSQDPHLSQACLDGIRRIIS